MNRPENPMRTIIESIKNESLAETDKFAEAFNIQNRLQLDPGSNIVFRYYFAAYHIQKSPESIRLARSVKHPLNAALSRIPLLNKLVSFEASLEGAYDTAAQELMQDAQIRADLIRELSTLRSTISTNIDNVLSQLVDTNSSLDNIRRQAEEIKTSSQNLQSKDPNSIKRLANLLTAAYLNETVDPDKRQDTIEKVLTTFIF